MSAKATPDRELLELVAKVAGLGPLSDLPRCNPNGGAYTEYVTTDHFEWNPLENDGDALRLAVKLWLEVRVFNGKAHSGRQGEFWCTEESGEDPCSATRRAIVRAAAYLAEDAS